MKVRAIREHSTRNAVAVVQVREVEMEPCCDAMRDALSKRAVGFGSYDKAFSTNEHVNIYRCKPWPGGTAWDDIAINYCPFCGMPISIKVDSMQGDDAGSAGEQ